MDFFSGQVISRLISRFMAKFHDFWAPKGLRLLGGFANDSGEPTLNRQPN